MRKKLQWEMPTEWLNELKRKLLYKKRAIERKEEVNFNIFFHFKNLN